MAVDWGDDENPRVSRAALRRVFSYFAPHQRRGWLVVACIAGQAVLGLAPAVVFKGLIDYLGNPVSGFGPVVLWVAAGIAAAVVGALLGVARVYHSTLISQDIVLELRGQLFERLLAQPVGFFTRSRSGEVMSRLSNDVNGVETVVTDTVFGLVRNALYTVATLALMLMFSWQMTLVALALIPLVGWPMRRAGTATYRARGRTQTKVAEMFAYLQETLGISGVLLVKAFGKARAEQARFGRLNAEVRHLQVREVMVSSWFGMLTVTLEVAGPALMMLAGGYLVITGRTTVGTVFVFATVLGARLSGALSALATMHVNVVGSLALFRRLFAYIDRVPEVADAPQARPLPTVRGSVCLEGVTFTYPNANRPALADVTLDVQPGMLVALVGPSGAGKTTLTSLVPRFYDPQAGVVRIDGHDLRTVTLESLAAHVGLVFQDTFLFHASVADNLRYARPGATDAELVAAATAAHLHEVVVSLPEGYDTVVGERGHRLSGGERQRLAIARVILKDPRVLILDEATSHLDSVSEQLIQAALRPLFAGRTSLVIAHRLSTVLAADLICVLDRGRIVERGTHARLVERGGLYTTLYRRQFRDNGDGEPVDHDLRDGRLGDGQPGDGQPDDRLVESDAVLASGTRPGPAG
jgi:ATP-binding cassette subfamily B protein